MEIQKKSFEDVLILSWNLDYSIHSILKKADKNQRMVRNCYRFNGSFFMNMVRELWFSLGLPGAQWWYAPSLKAFEGLIIVFDAMIRLDFLKWLKQSNPNARVVFWYWKAVSKKQVQPEDARKLGCEVWSFSPADCQKYEMKYSEQFYIKNTYEFLADAASVEPEHDIVFVGRDKGRVSQIKELMTKPVWSKCRWFLYVTADHFYQRYQSKEYRPLVSYEETLRMQQKGKAILEIVYSNTTGTTLRIFDAAYLRRKLITNSVDIQKMRMYTPHNVFIIGTDSEDRLEEFLNTPFHPIPEEVLEQYAFGSWLQRILEDKPSELFS